MQAEQIQRFSVGGEVYEGAKPRYVKMVGEGQSGQFEKVTKGVPFRKISKPMSRAEKRMNRRPKHGYGHAGAPIERSVAT